ncbi:MAG: hypothetical protein M3Y54_09440 [Bacteroidota bacterium]|nr:hypothetical protein [Bacteroidota bacterium]
MGFLTALVLIIYTGVAALAGFLGKLEAGALDIVLLVGGVVLAIRRLKKVYGSHLTYFQGFGTGIITALTASVVLGAFFWLLGGISKEAVRQIEARDLFGADMGVLIGGLGIILLGTMTGVVTSLIAMQYYKSEDHQSLPEMES